MKMLDFNAIEKPTWPIKLKDEKQTVVTLSTPTVELVDRLIALTPDLEAIAKTKDGNTVRKVYELVADLINCNEDGFAVTAEALRAVYKMQLIDLILFAAGYMQFVKEMNNAKN